MKGVVFTEFLEMVEEKFGMDTIDDIIESCDLPSGGAYTAVGTYDHGEMVSLVSALSAKSGIAVSDLLKAYGEHLFGRFAALYPAFFARDISALDFLEGVESYIHVEVKKLYPSAELPRFDCSRPSADELVMIYHSGRHLEDLAEGLIRGCLNHFGEEGVIVRDGEDSEGGVRFVIEATSCRKTVPGS